MSNRIIRSLFLSQALIVTNGHAAFIEAAIGPAIPADATGVYFNPGALVLVKKPQLLAVGAYVPVRFHFEGTTIQNATRYTETGRAFSKTIYRLPAGFLAVPLGERFTFGFGQIYNNFGKLDFPDYSPLRYFNTFSALSTLDLMTTLTYKISEKVAIGAGLDIEHIKIELNSVNGSPPLGISDVTLKNRSSGNGTGGHVGILVQPKRGTLIGLAYHSAVQFKTAGQSTVLSPVPFRSNDYSLKASMPASTVLSVDQYVTQDLGFIGTVQYMQWSVIKILELNNIAARRLGRNFLLPLARNSFFLADAWRFQLGTHYNLTKKLTVRAAAAYDQDPNNPLYQIGPDDNILLSANATWKANDALSLEGGYSHVFYKSQTINIVNLANTITGKSGGGRDAVVVKVIWNFV